MRGQADFCSLLKSAAPRQPMTMAQRWLDPLP
jgi:hypothetical protein